MLNWMGVTKKIINIEQNIIKSWPQIFVLFVLQQVQWETGMCGSLDLHLDSIALFFFNYISKCGCAVSGWWLFLYLLLYIITLIPILLLSCNFICNGPWGRYTRIREFIFEFLIGCVGIIHISPWQIFQQKLIVPDVSVDQKLCKYCLCYIVYIQYIQCHAIFFLLKQICWCSCSGTWNDGWRILLDEP